MKHRQNILGFTLVELVIAVAIVGILVGIAIPSYMTSVRKSNRAEAKTELSDAALRLQRCYTSYGGYNSGSCIAYGQLVAGLITPGSGYYKITIDVGPSGQALTSYKLTATAIKAPQLSDTGCTFLYLDNTGNKYGSAACW